jgi:hypothetical protein
MQRVAWMLVNLSVIDDAAELHLFCSSSSISNVMHCNISEGEHFFQRFKWVSFDSLFQFFLHISSNPVNLQH